MIATVRCIMVIIFTTVLNACVESKDGSSLFDKSDPIAVSELVGTYYEIDIEQGKRKESTHEFREISNGNLISYIGGGVQR
ncbi:hypothetical protein [Azospirillum sp. B506]|uniref:hypothetical protein n=1 Tax=Azospirillum sp. B506 TaxID=137721 RepID=UPI0011DDF574|nr:hypothetical protein [Azospirillum sp. B506]